MVDHDLKDAVGPRNSRDLACGQSRFHSEALAGNLKQEKYTCNGSDPTCAPRHRGHSNTGVTIPDCRGAHRGPNGTAIQCK